MFTNKTNVILTISILLNLVLAGIFIGGYLNKSKWHRLDLSAIEQSDIKPESKKLIKDTLTDLKDYKKSKFKDIIAIKAEINNIISADKFNKKSYKKQTKKIKALRDEMFAKMTKKISGLAQKLNLEERKVLAEVFNKKFKKYKKMKKDK